MFYTRLKARVSAHEENEKLSPPLTPTPPRYLLTWCLPFVLFDNGLRGRARAKSGVLTEEPLTQRLRVFFIKQAIQKGREPAVVRPPPPHRRVHVVGIYNARRPPLFQNEGFEPVMGLVPRLLGIWVAWDSREARGRAFDAFLPRSGVRKTRKTIT